MDRIINWYILVIIFVFDPLAIALVIAANFAFAQITKREESPELTEEDKEWLEADLVEEDEWEEPNENLKKAAKEYKEQTGVHVMVDPKTGKFFYEEPDPEPEVEVVMSGEPSLQNLDLDGDGVVETEELQEVFDKADTNDDGFIDDQEAKVANLDPQTVEKLNQINSQVEGVVDNVKQYYNFNPEELNKINEQIKKIKKLSFELGSLNNKKEDDNTITYF